VAETDGLENLRHDNRDTGRPVFTVEERVALAVTQFQGSLGLARYHFATREDNFEVACVGGASSASK
jgi:hypothetical protein